MAISALDDLLRALHNALIETQKLTEQQHIRQLMRYVKKEDNTPETISVKVPYLQPDSKNKWREVDVPLLAIMASSSVKIQDVKFNFKVRIDGFGDDETKGFAIEADKAKEVHKGPLQIDPGSRQDSDNLAEVNITFVSSDPPEAMFRITESLGKLVP